MTETKTYCDHCRKELNYMHDYINCDIDMWDEEINVDLCNECLGQLIKIVKDFCSCRERREGE